MEESEEEKVCGNCHRSVKKSIYTIHSAHCLRFIQLCDLCEEPVAQAAMKDHTVEQHSQVRCPLCQSTMEKYKLETHQSEQCEERPASCRYCDLDQPHRLLKEHEEVCGSWTELCPDCHTYVMYKSRQTHGHTCGQGPGPGLSQADDSETGGETREKNVPEDLLLPNQKKWNPLDTSPYSSQSQEAEVSASASALAVTSPSGPQEEHLLFSALSFSNKAGRGGGDGACEIDSCSVCHCALPIEILHGHEVKCRVFNALRNKSTRLGGPKEDKLRANPEPGSSR